jgi:phosphatidate cytidylyltransferase
MYAGLFSYIYALRYHDYAVGARAGTALVVLPLLLTWATDIGAYAFGRAFGKKKLIPAVSPGKTVEGAVGGLGLTIIVCLLYVRFILMPYAQLGLTIQGAVLFAIVISVAAQIGDLAESLLKREAGVKDSSRIIPGHGGILDRFDSILFVMPIAFLLLGRLLLPIPQ